MTTGENIRRARKARGFTQQELGRAIGVSQQQIGQYEKGQRAPKIETVLRIAAALDCAALDLLDNKEGLMMLGKNEGYKIIAREVYSTSRLGQQDSIVLGRNETKYGSMYVTWESTGWPLRDGGMKFDYYWGHYHDDEAKARADYHRRLTEKYER